MGIPVGWIKENASRFRAEAGERFKQHDRVAEVCACGRILAVGIAGPVDGAEAKKWRLRVFIMNGEEAQVCG